MISASTKGTFNFSKQAAGLIIATCLVPQRHEFAEGNTQEICGSNHDASATSPEAFNLRRENVRKKSAAVVLMVRRYGGLKSASDRNAKPLFEREAAQDESGSEENLLPAVH
jgi:hypothetical protein